MADKKRYLIDALQDVGEIEWFIGILKDEDVLSYLEIGSRFGGALWKVSNSLPKGSRIVSVDLPHGQGNKSGRESLVECIDELGRIGYDAHLFIGNSTDHNIVSHVRNLGPFDAAFIDGDHSIAGVTADWINYGSMAGIVAFHDIVWRRDADWKGKKIDVPKLWGELKDAYRHKECRLDPQKKDNGIGVLWR